MEMQPLQNGLQAQQLGLPNLNSPGVTSRFHLTFQGRGSTLPRLLPEQPKRRGSGPIPSITASMTCPPRKDCSVAVGKGNGNQVIVIVWVELAFALVLVLVVLPGVVGSSISDSRKGGRRSSRSSKFYASNGEDKLPKIVHVFVVPAVALHKAHFRRCMESESALRLINLVPVYQPAEANRFFFEVMVPVSGQFPVSPGFRSLNPQPRVSSWMPPVSK